MVCECGTVFCWDDADLIMLSGQKKIYCSETCKDRAWQQRHRKAKQVAACRRRGKQPYPDVSEARMVASRLFAKHGRMLYPYQCECGQWHLTKIPQGSPAFRNWLARTG